MTSMYKEKLNAKIVKLEAQICMCTRQGLKVMPCITVFGTNNIKDLTKNEIRSQMANTSTTTFLIKQTCLISPETCFTSQVSIKCEKSLRLLYYKNLKILTQTMKIHKKLSLILLHHYIYKASWQ